jgi:hypothetical protein
MVIFLGAIIARGKASHIKPIVNLNTSNMGIKTIRMLIECLENEDYAFASKTRGSGNSSESLFMALIFQQQKMISKLIQQLKSD